MKTKQEEINELRERLDSLEKSLKEENKERWKPEINQYYYIIDSCNDSISTFYDDRVLDNQRYEAFNMFQTREEAEEIAKYQLIFRKLYDFAKRNNGEFEEDGWFEVVFNNERGLYLLAVNYINSGCVRFSSEEVAKKAIECIGEEDIKWYLTFKA